MPVIQLTGNYGYQSYSLSNVAAATTIDASGATWIVSNSRNSHPTALLPWSEGTGQLNCYPVKITGAGAGLILFGGTILGEVPQSSDWQYTYNNSAGIRIEAAPGATIDEWRIDKAWDGVRIASGSGNFLIDDTYFSNIRDDAIENDYVLSGTIRDSLLDGVFSGISLGDGDLVDGSANTVTLEGVFLRSESYLYKGTVTHVSPIKTNTAAPELTPDIRIINSVIAIEDPNHAGQARLQLAWENVVESRGNVFLNLSDTPLPSTYPLPPAGFVVLQGQAARDYWEAAKAAWLDNHDGTPVSDITALPPLPGAVSSVSAVSGAELAPLSASELDHSLGGSISRVGEVDRVSFQLVAGTSYTFEALGAGALGANHLGDANLRLLNAGGSVVSADADSGVGRDAKLTFTASASGTYHLEVSSGSGGTGAYVLQSAVSGGSAFQGGNSYSVSNAATVVLERVGAAGQDVVQASASYALSERSEIEVLRTSSDKGKTAINLTGNDLGQALVGNAGSNVLDGRGGSDTLTGGLGSDRFVLGSGGAPGVDRITDYATGDVVDVSPLLNVAAGTNILTGGFLRVTTTGLVQVDLNGGGDQWSTLATINGSAAVAVRYLSAGVAATVSASRVADTTTVSTSTIKAAVVAEVAFVEPNDPLLSATHDSELASAPGSTEVASLWGFAEPSAWTAYPASGIERLADQLRLAQEGEGSQQGLLREPSGVSGARETEFASHWLADSAAAILGAMEPSGSASLIDQLLPPVQTAGLDDSTSLFEASRGEVDSEAAWAGSFPAPVMPVAEVFFSSSDWVSAI